MQHQPPDLGLALVEHEIVYKIPIDSQSLSSDSGRPADHVSGADTRDHSLEVADLEVRDPRLRYLCDSLRRVFQC